MNIHVGLDELYDELSRSLIDDKLDSFSEFSNKVAKHHEIELLRFALKNRVHIVVSVNWTETKDGIFYQNYKFFTKRHLNDAKKLASEVLGTTVIYNLLSRNDS